MNPMGCLFLFAEQATPTTSINRTVGVIVWVGLIVFSIAFFVLSWTRLGNAKPLIKCLTLSVFAHVLLAIFFYGTQMLGLEMDLGGNQPVTISLITESELDDTAPVEERVQPKLDEEYPEELPDSPAELVEPSEEIPNVVETVEPAEELPPVNEMPEQQVDQPTVAEPEITQKIESETLEVQESEEAEVVDENSGVDVEPDLFESAEEIVGESPVVPVESDSPTSVDARIEQVAAIEGQLEAIETVEPVPARDPMVRLDGKQIPKQYQARFNHSATEEIRGAAFGATLETEAAVRAGIEWLVKTQHENGRWDASEFGAGVDREVDGQRRGATGANADTGISGLALLALMGDGNTHLTGQYRITVQHGLEYLLGQQGSDGNLSGAASLFARMYCHAMATIAVCEAYALTGDKRLRGFAERAIGFTIRSQDKQTGGWRYQPADAGDMSQFGWQVLALRSAQQAGMTVPQKTKELMVKFLASCNTGTRGGLAAYRPGFGATRTMTAESLTCRIWLDAHRSVEQVEEASEYIVLQLPSQSRPDLYYWYYGSLSMRQLGGPAWESWSGALKRVVPVIQLADGSWPTDTKWGGYGGKVYSTAMAVLCLESFYRYQ